MNPKKDNPFVELDQMTTEIEQMFFRFFGGPRLRVMKGGAFQPLADVFVLKKTNVVMVKLDIAGIKPADVRLSLQDKTLTVEGARIDPKQDSDKVYQQMEIDYGSFKRKIILPAAVDVEKANAGYEDGFLTIELPMVTEIHPVVKVPISVNKNKEGES